MKELMQRRDGPAIRDTIIWLGSMVVLARWAAHFWFSIWSLIFFAGYGVLYGSASTPSTRHGTAFKTRWMNTAVYNLASFMTMRNPTVGRWSHTRHHTDTIVVGRDPEYLRCGLRRSCTSSATSSVSSTSPRPSRTCPSTRPVG